MHIHRQDPHRHRDRPVFFSQGDPLSADLRRVGLEAQYAVWTDSVLPSLPVVVRQVAETWDSRANMDDKEGQLGYQERR